jgi:hypothetical protein
MRPTVTTLAITAALALAGCANDADVASRNLSQAADNFEINRRVIFVNTWTDTYLLVVEGLCSIGAGTSAKSVTVTCKVAPGDYKKHVLGLSDNVTYFVEQLAPAKTGTSHYRVTFKPAVIIPDVDVRK